MTAGLPLMISVLTPLAKRFLIPCNSSSRCRFSKENLWMRLPFALSFVRITALIISNEEMKEMTKIVKSLEESGLLIKRISETIKNEAKEQKWRFLLTLLEILAVSRSGNALIGKGIIRANEGVIIAGQSF